MDRKQKIGIKIKEARTELGWSQRDLAKLYGSSDVNISEMERGIIRISISDLERMAHILGKSFEWFMSDKIEQPDRPIEAISAELQQAIKRFEVRMIPILGHAQFSTTMDIYSHVIPSMQQKAAQSFDAAFESLYNTDDTETKKEC